MILPPFKAERNQKVKMIQFGGLDFRPKAPLGTMEHIQNLTGEGYPALTCRKPHSKAVEVGSIINALCAPGIEEETLTTFTGVRNGEFYYRGDKIGGVRLLDGKKSIADFNGKICIFPDKAYFDYIPDPNTGMIVREVRSMEKTVEYLGVQFYSSYDTMTGSYTTYLYKAGGDFSQFSPGDSLSISGCIIDRNNTRSIDGRNDYAGEEDIVSAVVEKVEGDRMYLLLFNKKGGYATFRNVTEGGYVTIKVKIPDMDYVCVHNNRLWGASKNGEYIYASKLGDCQNFYSFQGLSDDSWYGRVGTPGGFTGICSYRSAVVAFKKECIHHIYGDAPRNFAIPKQTLGGCLDGRSIVELGGVLYYLSPRGFSAYSGGEPVLISHQLMGKDYTGAVAGTDGSRYTVAAYTRDKVCDVLVYDPRHGMWYREDDKPYIDFLFFGGKLYGATATAVWVFGQGEESVAWSAITNPITLSQMDHKGVNALWLRLERKEAAPVMVEISYDGKEFVLCGVSQREKGFGVERIPIRFRNCDSFRLRISGTGQVLLHDLEITTHQGGRTYGL